MQIKFDKILGCLRELDEGTGGGGTSGDTIITGTVATYAELPLASGYTGKYYIVDAATGTWILGTKKNAGIYKSNGTTWIYIDSVPETTSLSDGITTITGTNIVLEGSSGITTTTDVENNKIVIASPDLPTKTSDLTNDSNFITLSSVPDQLSDLSDDSTHRLVTDVEKNTWNSKQDSLGYIPEDVANKETSTLDTSIAKYPCNNVVKSAVDAKITANTAIIGATKTKITYDTNGLITAGSDATTADIEDSADKRYCTDAEKIVIGNTSGTNTGDKIKIGFAAHISNTTIPASTLTTVSFSTELEDTNNAWDGATFTVPAGQSGTYLITGCYSFNVTPDGNLIIAGVLKNSSTAILDLILGRQISGASGGTAIAGAGYMSLLAGDTIKMAVFSANATSGVINSGYCHFGAYKI